MHHALGLEIECIGHVVDATEEERKENLVSVFGPLTNAACYLHCLLVSPRLGTFVKVRRCPHANRSEDVVREVAKLGREKLLRPGTSKRGFLR